MRLLLFAAFFYIVYRIIKSAFSGGARHIPPGESGRPQEIDDVMVQDPYCKVYFPRRQGVSARVDGESLMFCSERCRDLYLEAKENPLKG
ncbi:MAG: hypothetical protein AB1921_14190 [Thermodesulfobacteriota bacterium]